MQLCFARRVVLATDNLVIAPLSGNEDGAFVERCFDIDAGEILHFLSRRWGGRCSRGRRLCFFVLRIGHGSQAEDSEHNRNNFKTELFHIRYSSG